MGLLSDAIDEKALGEAIQKAGEALVDRITDRVTKQLVPVLEAVIARQRAELIAQVETAVNAALDRLEALSPAIGPLEIPKIQLRLGGK